MLYEGINMIAEAAGRIKSLSLNGNGHAVQKKIRELDPEIIRKEIKNPALQELVLNISDIINKANRFEIDKEQAAIQIAAYKQLISIIVMDWNARSKS